MPLSLGISAFYHDSAVALVDDGQILFAAQEERFSRVKGDSRFPHLALKALIKETGLELSDIQSFNYYENPKLKRQRIFKTFMKYFPSNLNQIWNFASSFSYQKFYPLDFMEDLFKQPTNFYEHHMSHAASAFYPSNFPEAAVLVCDGVGEWSTSTIWKATRTEGTLKKLAEESFPDSLGLFYATMTSFCGFKVNSGEYKFMGLAPYGSPRFVNLIRENLLKVGELGEIKINRDYFSFPYSMNMWSLNMTSLFGAPARDPEDRIRAIDCDLAKSTQVILQEIYIRKARNALQLSGSENLCLAGGVALNCVANGELMKVFPGIKIFVQPASGDAGGALGAAILGDLRLGQKAKRRYEMLGSFLGTSYNTKIVEKSLTETKLKFTFLHKDELYLRIAQLLAANKSVGWFFGRMEFGPRALGARSILANPCSPEMQSRLNLQIKKRESFRPFAPMVLLEEADSWFDWPRNCPSPFMLFTAQVKQKHLCTQSASNKTRSDTEDLLSIVNQVRSSIPAVTHVDNSARLQTIDVSNPVWPVLKKFYDLTGFPILVNTSFNVRNEPIVECPEDAIRCFLTTDIDVLAIEGFVISKEEQDPDLLSQWKDKLFVGEAD